MELFHASNQWAKRPADERFNSLQDMYTVCRQYADNARTSVVRWNDLKADAQGDEVFLVGNTGQPARLTHFAFGQIAARAGAPASYLRELPAPLAAQCINHGMRENASQTGNDAQLLIHRNGSLVVRSATTTVYSRVWNHEVLARLLDLQERTGLVPARQTFTWDGTPLPPESERPASLYASDHDMFAFLMSADRVLTDPVGKQLYRGLIVSNSEVGDRKLSVMSFFFREVCANHIIWGASELLTIDLMHQGNIRQRWLDAQVKIRRYLDNGTSFDQSRFVEMKRRIADTKEGVLDALFGKRITGLTKQVAKQAYDAVIPDQDGDPRTFWGIAQGITRIARATSFADTRYDLDRAAGRVMDMAF